MSTSALNLQTKVKLRDGNEIPQLGFGTYEMSGEEAYQSVLTALEVGYRHIDTAAWYENEAECGKAILDFCKRTSTPRSDIFYTTKLRSNRGSAATVQAIEASLEKCGLGYIDLYLIHSPIGGSLRRSESWKEMVKAQEEGKLKSIGVSNYGVPHIQQMVDSGLPLPVVNQVDLGDFVRGVMPFDWVMQAWAPLVRGLRFKHPTVVEIAERHGKTAAQVLLRYSLQMGYVAIPKSVTKERIIANKEIYDFELSQEEMDNLFALDEYLVTDWDVTDEI
ncbi:Aldo/keto reductase [Serendipita vermifera]|nr:Aldo/keto reductase [Serendipita vermifera]